MHRMSDKYVVIFVVLLGGKGNKGRVCEVWAYMML